jgi:hypothetical protein
MKMFTIILTVSIAMTIKTNAQIPNNGFEDWTTDTSGIEIPSGIWVTDNLVEKPSGVTYNAVTKSSDHYPQNVGIYSIRLENNISFVNSNPESPYPYWRLAYGSTATAPLTSHYLGYNGPSFPITGHPTSFRGFYKFLPQNNDTLVIGLVLFKNGSPVASAFLNSTETVSNWTSFNLPISNYTTSDSAQIWLMALKTVPQGNSILYVDNLSFDTLITSVSLTPSELPMKFNLAQNYPNPFNPSTTIEYNIPHSGEVNINIYDIQGKLIKDISEYQDSPGDSKYIWNGKNNFGNQVASGTYFYQIRYGNVIQTKKMILLK